MSHVLLYKEGDQAVIRGVRCNFVRVRIGEIENYLADGYSVSVNDLYNTVADVDTNKSGALSVDEVREAAKNAGIEGWDKKRIKTLKKELGL